MDRVWLFHKVTGMAYLIPADTPCFPCKDEDDLRRIARKYREAVDAAALARRAEEKK